MHITDVHLDIFYTAGAESKCNEPECCRIGSVTNTPFNQLLAEQQQGKYR